MSTTTVNKNAKKSYGNFASLSNLPFYPLSYAKVLMQVSNIKINKCRIIYKLYFYVVMIYSVFLFAWFKVGYEPLPPFKSTNFFGNEQYYFPNTFRYRNFIWKDILTKKRRWFWRLKFNLVRYIADVEGFSGLYRGLGMKIISNIVGNSAHNHISKVNFK